MFYHGGHITKDLFMRLGNAPINLIAPVIGSTPIIGTLHVGDDGTWRGAVSFTYQWQRNGVDIVGATNKNYTPVDADFGYALRLVVTATNTVGSTETFSNTTNLTREAPAQALGGELLTNGSFAAWTADNPDGWTVAGEVGADPMVTEVGTGQDHTGAGTGCANLYATGATFLPQISQNILVSGSYYEVDAVVSLRNTTLNADLGGVQNNTPLGTSKALSRAAGVSFSLYTSSVAHDITTDSVGAKLITLNTQLTAPSANMRLDLFYTLPGSPVAGTQVWLLPRISNFAAGNYWVGVLTYTGTQWNINLYSVATHTRTSRIAAANIGATNGIRVNGNGDQISLYTTVNGGTNWTQRGTTITNSLYQTSTGVNAAWTSDVTPGQMIYAPAD